MELNTCKFFFYFQVKNTSHLERFLQITYNYSNKMNPPNPETTIPAVKNIAISLTTLK